MQEQTIYTITANCQDCYRCVRECPVKAISISGGQAKVEDSLCIKCGTCVRECPQQAKTIRSDLEKAKSMFVDDRFVAVSIAPSFAAMFSGALRRRLPSALRQLGFRFVGETAEGARYVTEESFAEAQKGNICTACPAVVNYMEKYRHEYLDSMIPVVSPMIAHGRMIKEKYPNSAVIFIGPCAAKKEEIVRPENIDAVDVVLTFGELLEWFESENIKLDSCSESNFDKFYKIGNARLFPIQGGMLKAGGISCDGTEAEILHVTGADDVIDLLSDSHNIEDKLIEPMFCKGGCIGGSFFSDENTTTEDRNLFSRRERVIKYSQAMEKNDVELLASKIPCTATFEHDEQNLIEVSETQINKILESTGKIDPAYQLNCGACGYKTCLENAIAVERGMAEPEMCIPYMRRLALQRTNQIIETTPDGVVILDSELCIIKMNPAFQKMFTCNNGILGRRISYLVNAEGFERLQSGIEEKNESIQTKYGIKYHEILYSMREDRQYVGFYSDISKLNYDSRQLDTIKAQTLMHAREFLDHQVQFSQEMAHFLGTSAAKSEGIAKRLIELYEQEDGEKS